MEKNKKKNTTEFESRFNMNILHILSKEQTTDADIKDELMRKSQFYSLINNGSQRNNCISLFNAIADCYDEGKEAFCINGKWMTICIKEVAYWLGLKSEGRSAKEGQKTCRFPSFFKSLCTNYSIHPTNDKKWLVKSNIQHILTNMVVQENEARVNFRKLLNFYFLSFVVYPQGGFGANRSNFSLVEDLIEFEEINWAYEILRTLLNSIKMLKKDATQRRYLCCITPLLEAWFYMRIGKTNETYIMGSEAAPIYQILGNLHLTKDDCKMLLSLYSSCVMNCKYQAECKEKENNLQCKEKENNLQPLLLSREVIEKHAWAIIEDCLVAFVKRCLHRTKDKFGILCDDEELILELKQELCGNENATILELVEVLAYKQNPKLLVYSRKRKNHKGNAEGGQQIDDKAQPDVEDGIQNDDKAQPDVEDGIQNDDKVQPDVDEQNPKLPVDSRKRKKHEGNAKALPNVKAPRATRYANIRKEVDSENKLTEKAKRKRYPAKSGCQGSCVKEKKRVTWNADLL